MSSSFSATSSSSCSRPTARPSWRASAPRLRRAQARRLGSPWASEPEANLEPGDLASVLKRAADARDRLEAIREAIPDDHLRFKLSAKAADQGTVTLTPARWRALLMVDGERDVLSIATLLGVPRMDALSVLAELVKEGVVETLPRPMHAEASMPPRHIAVETPLPPAVTRATEEATRPAASEPAPPATSGWPPARPREATTPAARGTGDWVLPSAAGVPPEQTSPPPATGVPPPTEVRGGLE